jgi:alanyl-tRNA synthetase
MTEALYFSSDELAAATVVLHCSASGENDGLYQLILNRTLFHPQGGGQPSDSGSIDTARVLRVIKNGDSIVHVTDRPLAEGPALMQVDAQVRQLNTRLHSAGHLISVVLEQAGWRAIKAHHWPGEARVVFEAGAALSIPAAGELEQACNLLLQAGHVRHVTLQPEGRKVGFGDLPAYFCGGTHVASLAQIGAVRISRVKEKKGQLSVHYAVAD